VHDLHSTVGAVAIGAAAVAVVALALALALTAQLRRLRAAQRIVLGESQQDVVAHAAGLKRAFDALSAYVEETAAQLEQRMAPVEARLDRAIAYRSLIHYDAYGEMSGRQSTSIALLDETRSGIVLSSIHHRDQARLYAKQVRDGQAEVQLSPEEEEAIRLAFESGAPSAASP
jgi:hypothetical protein